MEFLQVAIKGHVTHITLNRPEVMNAINPQMHDELESAFNQFSADDQQFLCVVRGAGEKAFCAGAI